MSAKLREMRHVLGAGTQGLQGQDTGAHSEAAYDPSRYLSFRLWEQETCTSTSLVDNTSALYTQALALARIHVQKRSPIGDSARVYIGDGTRFILTELGQTLTLADIRARGGVHPGNENGTFLPLTGRIEVHVFTYNPENVDSLYSIRQANNYW